MGYYDRMLRTLQAPSTNGGVGTGLGLAAIGQALSNISKISDDRAKQIEQKELADLDRAYKDSQMAMTIEQNINNQAQRKFENDMAVKKLALDTKFTQAQINNINTNAAIARDAHNLARLDNYTLTRLLQSFIQNGDTNSGLFAQYKFGVPIWVKGGDNITVPTKLVNKDDIANIKID
ncbi:hypothetical protein [Campylobacter sp.]|uniref:hypothetical protein n=1 Tax=Campylobacter sp. TaxID=205 RepID=UPI00259CA00E|nr:hypothetical protein [Campylobacter sp.]MBQ7134730.1 hypothetical protein [Campylobacter sp.]